MVDEHFKDVLAPFAITIVAGVALLPRLRRIYECHQERYNLRKITVQKNAQNENEEIKISGIFIHPVKSLRPVSVGQAYLDHLGLEDDRGIMICQPTPNQTFDPNQATHRFVTQRQCPALATITASIPVEVSSIFSKKKKIVQLSSKNSAKVSIDVSRWSLLNYPVRYRVGIWDDIVDVVDVGDEAASFVQAIMKTDEDSFQDVRVVSLIPGVTKRYNDERYLPKAARNPITGGVPKVSLTDGFPILVASEESLSELNNQLKIRGKSTLPMSRFRPNIVLKGQTKAFEEDTWKAIQIGGKNGPILHIVKGCPRCKQSCTDQLTGVRSSEPVETLTKFRALGSSKEDVYFAQNAILQAPLLCNKTLISVGDSVTVLTTGDPVWDIDSVKAE